jgi:hypothetical protein
MKVSCHLCGAVTGLTIRNDRNDCYDLWYDESVQADESVRAAALPRILVVFFESASETPAYNETPFAFCKTCFKSPHAFSAVWEFANSLQWHAEYFTEDSLKEMIEDSDDSNELGLRLQVWRDCASLTALAGAFGLDIRLVEVE